MTLILFFCVCRPISRFFLNSLFPIIWFSWSVFFYYVIIFIYFFPSFNFILMFCFDDNLEIYTIYCHISLSVCLCVCMYVTKIKVINNKTKVAISSYLFEMNEWQIFILFRFFLKFVFNFHLWTLNFFSTRIWILEWIFFVVVPMNI